MKLDDLTTVQMLGAAREELIRLRDGGRLLVRYVSPYRDVDLDPLIVDQCRPIVDRALNQRIAGLEADLQALGVEIA